MWQNIRNAPWISILLLGLLLSNLANLLAIRRMQLKVEEWGWDHHYLQSDTNSTLNAMNQRLLEVSESTTAVAACSKEIRPVWCKH